MDDAFNCFVFVAFEVPEGRSKRRAALPLRADDFEFEVILFQTANTIGPVAVFSFVVAVHVLTTFRRVVHKVGDHASQLIVEVCDLRFHLSFANLIAVTGVDGKIVHPQKVRLVFVFNLFPSGDVVIDECFVVIKRSIKRSSFRVQLDFFCDVRTWLAVNGVLFQRKETRVPLAMV